MTDRAFPEQPIERVEWVAADTLKANTYNPNHVARPELRLLEFSLLRQGWIQPLLVQREGREIIDGFHRWALAQDSTPVRERFGGMVPVVWLDLDRAEAMCLTVRINRAKGEHAAVPMVDIVTALIDEHGWDHEQVAQQMGMTRDEVELLHRSDLFHDHGLDKVPYSKAWVPRETGTRTAAEEDAG